MSDVMTRNALFRRINYVLMYAFVKRQKRLMIGRERYLKCHFIEGLTKVCNSHEIASVVWSRMQRESALIECDFKPMGEDLLGEHFGIENEDVRDLIVELARECGKEIPRWEEIEVDRIKTVRDLAKLLSELRDAQR